LELRAGLAKINTVVSCSKQSSSIEVHLRSAGTNLAICMSTYEKNFY